MQDIYGLILAGGKSQRMGRDKSMIKWHGKIQREYLAELLDKVCARTYFSCRPEQQKDFITHKTISDAYPDLGPYGALLSAMAKYPERSWLVVACDIPLIGEEDLRHLISRRDETKIATAYCNLEDGLPEPLAAIWESASRSRLLELLGEGVTCPRKALIKSAEHVKLVKPLTAEAVMNTNTPEDADLAKKIIARRQKELSR